MEAITSRRLLLVAVDTTASHAGQATMLQPLIANIRATLQHVKDTAEQFRGMNRWGLLHYVSDKIAPTLRPFMTAVESPAMVNCRI